MLLVSQSFKTPRDSANDNLKGEENIVIDDNRYRQLQDLFGFVAIPFCVTFTPDGYMVREGLPLHAAGAGYDFFIEQLEMMKAKCGWE